MIKPYYSEPNIKIYLGNCLEVMKELPDKSIDCVITDPPYSLPNNQFRPKARILQRTFGDFSPYQTFFKQFIIEIKRIIKDDGNLIIFCDETFYPVIYPELYQNFYATKLIVWNKERIGMGGIWRRQFELITHSYFKPKKEKSGDGDIVYGKPVKEKLHNSQKPIKIIEKLIKKSSNDNDTILDPFLGSGTTCRAAKDLGRKCIGIEINEEYVKIAIQRLGQEILNFND